MNKKICLFIFFLFCHIKAIAGTCIDANEYTTFPSIFFSDACGEESPDSNFFDPQIRVRIQNCNFS